MAKKAELGEKRVCPECEAKFYDLTKNPATCPMCGHSFDPAELEPKPIMPLALLRLKKMMTMKTAKRKKPLMKKILTKKKPPRKS